MKKKFLLLIGFVLIALLTIVIVGFLSSKVASDKLKVVTTTTQLYDITKNIVGENVDLAVIFSSNTDPHEYQPTPADIEKLQSADLIIFNGVDLEHAIEDTIEESSAQKLNASESLEILESHEEQSETEEDHGHEAGDPHIWFDVSNVIKIVTSIKNKISEMDSDNLEIYRTNTGEYLNELEALDTYIKIQIQRIPEENRKLVTNHDAFGYYVKAYDLEYVGSVIPSLSTEDQPTPAETAELIQKIKEQNVKAIFIENTASTKLASQIANETGTKVISTLFGDTLGREGSKGDTYIEMMMFNTLEIVKALI